MPRTQHGMFLVSKYGLSGHANVCTPKIPLTLTTQYDALLHFLNLTFVGKHPSRRSPEEKSHTPVDPFDGLGPVSIFFVNRGLDSTILGASEEMRIHTSWCEKVATE